MAQHVYIVTRYNDTYDAPEDICLFSSEKKARKAIEDTKNLAERELGSVEEYRNDRAAAYVTFTNEDNHVITCSLDLVPQKIY